MKHINDATHHDIEVPTTARPPTGPYSGRKRARERGAQPGNQNARKHGRYSRLQPIDWQQAYNALAARDTRKKIDALSDMVITLVQDPDAPESLIRTAVDALCAFRKIHRKRRRLLR